MYILSSSSCMVVRALGIRGLEAFWDQVTRRGAGVSKQFGLFKVRLLVKVIKTWLIPLGNFGTTEFVLADF